MKKTAIAAALLCLAAGFSTQTFAADPCEVVLCMYGKVTGDQQSECSSQEREFFSINAFKKKGRFDPTKTADMRKQLLGKCSSADPAKIADIISKFGKVRG